MRVLPRSTVLAAVVLFGLYQSGLDWTDPRLPGLGNGAGSAGTCPTCRGPISDGRCPEGCLNLSPDLPPDLPSLPSDNLLDSE